MDDKKMLAAMEQFILQRINDHGADESEELGNAYAAFKESAEKLFRTMNDSQKKLYCDCENAYALLDGETLQFYYRAGFSDAVLFLTEWRNRK